MSQLTRLETVPANLDRYLGGCSESRLVIYEGRQNFNRYESAAYQNSYTASLGGFCGSSLCCGRGYRDEL